LANGAPAPILLAQRDPIRCAVLFWR
jgi:hypothetical protein